ncbi:MAG: hypothetical protein ACR2MK_08235 [Solirubrobacteraceae bacterium]
MSTTSETAVRELDRRANDGIDVRLLWNAQTDSISVAVEDKRSGESFELESIPRTRSPLSTTPTPTPTPSIMRSPRDRSHEGER